MIDFIYKRINDKNASSIKHETEISRYRNRQAQDYKRLKESIGNSKSATSLASKNFKVAVNHAGSPTVKEPIVIYNLPTVRSPKDHASHLQSFDVSRPFSIRSNSDITHL